MVDLDFKCINKNKSIRNGTIIFLHDFVIHKGEFSITTIKVSDNERKSVVFNNWYQSTFDGDVHEAEKFYQKIKLENVILIDFQYDASDFKLYESNIKNQLGKIISKEFSFYG